MEYRHLGRLGLRVSPLCLGTMNFGPQTGEAESHAIMDHALELGINFFDTANVYGQHKGVGATETIVGNWFAKGGGRREKVVLATKVYSEMGSWPNESRLSALNIRRACDESLRRLQTDHIDLYQMHHVYREATWDEIWQAFETLVQQGKILYVGSSNFAGWHIAKANEAAKIRHFLGLVSEQCIYNLAERTVEMDVLPACHDYGLGVIPWSPLWRGLLAGVLDGEKQGRRGSGMVQDKLGEVRPQVEAYEKFCAELGHPPAEVALAWLLANPVVTAPIVGPRVVDQLDGAMRALDVKLDRAAMKRLDEIWPGPGGPAPEAFAW
ncbi:MAG TPA: aldo/keto reductase [Actinomycetota bacterium]|nr:aldo/keto reductase [Actinomycetota bacterium]